MSADSLRRAVDRIPLTPAGLVVVVIGVLSFLAALVVGWLELFVVAAGCLVALLLSLPFVIGRSKLQLTRTLIPERVTAGERARASLLALNTSSVPLTRRQILDVVEARGEARPELLELPTLLPGAKHVQSYPLPAARRGTVTVGPARITKSDPFGLMQRDVGQTGVDTLWVQPRVVPCAAFAAGIAKDVEGPTFDTSPAGDVAFHALRPYQLGDDARHVHWMATARTGNMMVRHYVDNRQPYLSVILDPARSSWNTGGDPEAAFDIGVEVAASLAVSAMHERRPVSLHDGDSSIVGRHHPATPQDVLDALTTVTLRDDFDVVAAAPRLIAAERETSVTAIVTGPRPMDDFLIPISVLRRSSHVVLIRVVSEGDEGSSTLGGARVLNISSLDSFVALSSVVTSR